MVYSYSGVNSILLCIGIPYDFKWRLIRKGGLESFFRMLLVKSLFTLVISLVPVRGYVSTLSSKFCELDSPGSGMLLNFSTPIYIQAIFVLPEKPRPYVWGTIRCRNPYRVVELLRALWACHAQNGGKDR